MPDGDPTGGPDGSQFPHERILLAITSAAQFMVVLDVSVVNVALPTIGRALHYGPTALQWVPNAYVLTFAGFLLLGGRIADFFGRRRAFLAGLTLFVGASLLCATAQSTLWLTLARALQGMGSALLSPATLTIVVTTFSGPRLSKAIGLWAAVGSVGGSVGLFLGGVITTELGWRWIFFINVPVGVVAGIGAIAVITEHRRVVGSRSLDIPGAVTVTAGLALLAYAVVDTNRYAWLSARTLGSLAVAGALLGAFFVIQLRSSRPLMPLRLFRSRWVSGANAIVFLMGCWTFSGWYFLSLYLQNVVGFSPLRTGIALVPMTFMITLGAQLSSRVCLPRLGIRRTVQMALVFIVAGYSWLSTLVAADRYWAVMFGGLMLTSMGQGLLFTPLAASATGAVDRSEAGLASGLLNNSRQVGGSVGLAALATIAVARTHQFLAAGRIHSAALTAGYARAFSVMAGLAVLAFAITFVLPRRAAAHPPTTVVAAPDEVLADEPPTAAPSVH